VAAGLLDLAGCSRKEAPEFVDHPRLIPAVSLLDVTFHAGSLGRDMKYRVIMPAQVAPGQTLPVLYLLHGGGEDFHAWSNYSNVAGYAAAGLILVMPEGESSYYVNAVERPKDRFEDYIVHDLIADVEQRLPARTGRENRAIAGVSMGGFGAVLLALKHPELFAFAGGISPALDVPSRPFSIKRVDQWRRHSAIFGPWGGSHRRENDPYVIAGSADPAQSPYLFLTCGEQEGLLPANRKFGALLGKRGFHYEFHPGPGGHDWNQWNRQLPELMMSVNEHIHH
jgi:S-formylglutathione hydrolase FrmB